MSDKNIIETAVSVDDLSTLVAAVKAADLVETLSGTGPFTVFAPTNEAFAKIPSQTLAELLKPENKDKLTAILTYHVVAAKALSTDLSDGQEISTVNGATLKVSIKDGMVMINDSKVITADLVQSNGVVHLIDSVLMP
ncbi:MAG: fasciclin domain-containing protein [bacterium]